MPRELRGIDDAALRSYAAIIVPSGMVSDRLRYTEDVNKMPPATSFSSAPSPTRTVLKGIICHGLWLVAPAPELVRGRKMTCHNNLIGDAKAYGVIYTDQDVVVDGDLVSGRTGGHCHLFARQIIDILASR
jgi:protease I